ncbi:MAG: methionyl-tRNA formyltransferase [Patescibacteria group bacterium]|jgi:methionyl-tRNA formyltransferase|nr:methionyl-tRNA formyltransferase [Patescibacteria group bacterium]
MENKNIKFAFWGTPSVASDTLQILIDNGLTPSVVITNPDRKQGRGLELTQSPVKVLALKHGIQVLTPEKIDDDFINNFSKLNIDLSIVVAYGSILPENIISMPKFGTLNIHYSLLPKYRGASPVESALLNGDEETGVTIQKMIRKLDAGDIVATESLSINQTITKDELRNELINLGANLLIKILPDYIENKINTVQQDESQATHCGKIKKEDGLIDLNDDTNINYNKYRAYSGWPGIHFFQDGKRIKVTSAHLEDGKFVIDKVIPEGKKETTYKKI